MNSINQVRSLAIFFAVTLFAGGSLAQNSGGVSPHLPNAKSTKSIGNAQFATAKTEKSNASLAILGGILGSVAGGLNGAAVGAVVAGSGSQNRVDAAGETAANQYPAPTGGGTGLPSGSNLDPVLFIFSIFGAFLPPSESDQRAAARARGEAAQQRIENRNFLIVAGIGLGAGAVMGAVVGTGVGFKFSTSLSE